MIRFNCFQFLNEDKEHILDGEVFRGEGGELGLTVHAGGESEYYAVSSQEVLELAQALINLVEEARAGYDTTTDR